MPFEGGSNSTYTKDYSGFGNDWTVTDVIWNSTGGYDKKGAYEFDGDNDYITSNENSSMDNFTVSLWIYRKGNSSRHATYPTYGTYVRDNRAILQGGSTTLGWCVGGHSSLVRFDFGNGTAGYRVSTSGLSLNHAWNHVLITRTSLHCNSSIYVNGVYKESLDDTMANHVCGEITNPATITYIGTDLTYGDFNGTIDEVMIFNRSLTPEQILALYQNGTQTIASAETTKGEYWHASVTPNDGLEDGTTLNTTWIYIENSEPIINLSSPANGDTIYDRTPTLIWNATDYDNDNLTFHLLFADNDNFTNPIVNLSNITDTNYTITTILDINTTYFWKIRANDSEGYTNFTDIWNFTEESSIIITLIINSTDFGEMGPGNADNTTDNNPQPLLAQNDGNIDADIVINGTDMFETVPNPTEYYQYKIGINESNSFNESQSTMDWKNMSPTNIYVDIDTLKWGDNDTAEIELKIYLPSPFAEPPGNKTSIITLTAEAS